MDDEPSTYVRRLADVRLEAMLAAHQAVMVVGPRACGKSTTAGRHAASEIRLGQAAVANSVRADPAAVIRRLDRPVLIDEWQVVPDVLGAVKEAVDRDSARGQFVLTGSVRGESESPTWPGTGRLTRLPMFGLIEREIERRTDSVPWLDRVVTGDHFEGYHSDDDIGSYVDRALRSGFPEPALRVSADERPAWLGSYVDQLVTRDVEAVDQRRDPARLRRYLEAVTLHSAGVVDDSTLWQAARINHQTAVAYDALLTDLFAITSVPAWTPNRLKRLVLAPKRFVVDSALFVGVLGVTGSDVLLDANLLGRVLETFVHTQLRSEFALSSRPLRMRHLRLPQGRREIDVIVELAPRRIVAIEIKATSSPGPDDATHLRWLHTEFGDAVVARVLLHAGPHAFTMADGVVALPISTLWS